LQKDLQKRLRDIGDAGLDLEEALAEPAKAGATPISSRMTRRTVISTLAAAIGRILGANAQVMSDEESSVFGCQSTVEGT